jgi:uncharacterized protein (DUF2384 family)
MDVVLQNLVQRLAQVYEPEEARLWMFSPQKLLEGKTPAALIEKGHADEVIKVIRQIEEGVHI